MAPVPHTNAITHFTHPGHRLSPVTAAMEYRCDGCKTTGTGVRFRCDPCDFDLHDYCATCPTTLSSFMHPHPLSLVQRKPQSTRTIERVCDVCREAVNGLFYRCKGCEFDVHPLCTQLPTSLRHPLHLPHPLIFRSSGSGWCAVCRGACDSWRYRCVTCGFDIHLGCILANQRNVPSFNHPPPPPHMGGYGQPAPAYGGYGYGVPSGSGVYGNYGNQVVNEGSGEIGGNGGKNISMYSLVGKLAFGLLTNVDLSSFM